MKIKEQFHINNDLLIFKNKNNRSRIVFPKSLQNTILKMVHDNNGHMDYYKTFSKLASRYYWSSMSKDCKNYVASCHLCQQLNRRTAKSSGLLKPRKIPERPFDNISMDHCSFPEDTRGKKYVLILIHHTTRYVIAKALNNTSSKHMTTTIEKEIIHKYGPPKIFISDNATGFTSNRMNEFYKKFSIENITSPPYWAESNGLVERSVATITSIIRKKVHQHNNKEEWSKYLPNIISAINASKQSSLQQSPFYLLHGFEPRLKDESTYGTIDADENRQQQIIKLENIRQESYEKLSHIIIPYHRSTLTKSEFS